MKKKDIILLFSVILLGIIFIVTGKLTAADGDTVIVTLGGKPYSEYPLYEDTEININGTNIAVIENGSVYMQSATCPDHLCVKQGKITDNSRKIICLPNRITIEVTTKSEIDKVVR